MDTKYIELFLLIESILEEQKKQRLRGLNDYNMVNIVRKETQEVGMHSNVIISLIDPDGLHYQDDLFLNLFIEKVIKPKIKCQDFGNIFSVQAEELTDDNRRIDFTIKSDKYLIGIEMKVNAGDLENQIEDYYKQLLQEANNDPDKVYIFYLTKYGEDPSAHSSGTVPKDKIKNISFKNDIIKWINACQEEVNNITNLNVALEDYKNIVKKITNQYEGNVMSITKDLLNKSNQDKLATALKLDKDMPTIKAQILFDFFSQISQILTSNANIIDISDKINDSKRVVDELKCINIYKPNNTSGNKSICFGKFYDCGLSSNRYLHIEVVSENIYYGVVELDENNGMYKLIKINEDTALEGLLKYSKWNEITWYIKDDKKVNEINIIELHDEKSSSMLLDFENSDLKSNLLDFVKEIQNI